MFIFVAIYFNRLHIGGWATIADNDVDLFGITMLKKALAVELYYVHP